MNLDLYLNIFCVDFGYDVYNFTEEIFEKKNGVLKGTFFMPN